MQQNNKGQSRMQVNNTTMEIILTFVVEQLNTLSVRGERGFNKLNLVQKVNEAHKHRRNEEGDQGEPWAPPIRSKKGAKSFIIGPFWGMVIHENTCCKT